MALGVVWFPHHSAVLAQVMPSGPPRARLHEARIVLRDRGEKRAEVHAARVDVSPDARYAIFTGGSTGDVYERGRVMLRLHADEIVLDRETNGLSARGHVEITSSQSDRVVGSEARWDNGSHRLELSGGVSITFGRGEAQASRLTIDTGLQTFDLTGSVDVHFFQGGSPR